MDPIVITNQEVAQAQIPVQGAPEVRPKMPNPVALWARLLFVPLVLVLPLLSLAALILRIAIRGQAPRVQADMGLVSADVADHQRIPFHVLAILVFSIAQ